MYGNDPAARIASVNAASLAALRSDMVRFAYLQLRDSSLAEDAVQEALAAALADRERFSGRSQLRTWVYAILRNKIVDILRQRIRHPAQSYDELGPDSDIDAAFDDRGFWRNEHRPSDWSQPETELENTQFWRVFEACLLHLSENVGRVFMMREMLGLETGEICRALGITESNCWVILHRARMRLRSCLDESWFDEREST